MATLQEEQAERIAEQRKKVQALAAECIYESRGGQHSFPTC